MDPIFFRLNRMARNLSGRSSEVVRAGLRLGGGGAAGVHACFVGFVTGRPLNQGFLETADQWFVGPSPQAQPADGRISAGGPWPGNAATPQRQQHLSS
jgi:hypothetical protein